MYQQIQGWVASLTDPATVARLRARLEPSLQQFRRRMEAVRQDPPTRADIERYVRQIAGFLHTRNRRQWALLVCAVLGFIVLFGCGLMYRAEERLGRQQVAAAEAAVDSKEITDSTVYCTHLLSVPDGRRDIVGHSVQRDTLEETIAREANWMVTKDYQVDESYCFNDWAALARFMTGGALELPKETSEGEFTILMLEYVTAQGSSYQPPRMPWNQ